MIESNSELLYDPQRKQYCDETTSAFVFAALSVIICVHAAPSAWAFIHWLRQGQYSTKKRKKHEVHVHTDLKDRSIVRVVEETIKITEHLLWSGYCQLQANMPKTNHPFIFLEDTSRTRIKNTQIWLVCT